MRRASRPGWHRRRNSGDEDDENVAAGILGWLIDEPDAPESREIRQLLSRELQNDASLLRALVTATQMLRDTGALSYDEAWYLIGYLTECFTFGFPETDFELRQLGEAMSEIERRHGLTEEEAFLIDEAPPEYRELSGQWDRRLDQMWSALLLELDEPVMGALLGTDEYSRRWEAGVMSIRRRQSSSG